ncbi:unnamed protein product [Microthlaspi erraticum]|uniref:Uncharacterized protein n=1 Tax=Microthlaspi erraticum TaxID=1685480 RepID=A0A6D2LBK5_9BRAS|nr:unnamed protein product [Microthlaspi erraticum]
MEISYLDKQEGYENGKECPDMYVCPPKNWEARSWSGDGQTAIRSTPLDWVPSHSIELALGSIELCLELALFFLKPVPARLSKKNRDKR